MEDAVDVLNGKSIILKEAEKPQVDDQVENEGRPLQAGFILIFVVSDRASGKIVEQDTEHHQQDIDRLTPCIKDEAHDQQYEVFGFPRYHIIQDQCYRQKDADEKQTAENHKCYFLQTVFERGIDLLRVRGYNEQKIGSLFI